MPFLQLIGHGLDNELLVFFFRIGNSPFAALCPVFDSSVSRSTELALESSRLLENKKSSTYWTQMDP